jgi:hypothetical protein
MSRHAVWSGLREQCEGLDPGAELVTPLSGRRFRISATFSDRIVVRFEDSDEERSLWREQFQVLVDRPGDAEIDLAELAPGVEPYATVLSLSGDYRAGDGTLAYAPDEAEPGESPYLVSAAAARAPPERVHDDALLLAALLERVGDRDPASLETETLTDLYVLLSDVQRGTDRLRRTAREPILARLGPGQSLSGRFGTVRRTTREYRRPKDDEVVLDALDEHGIPREWVLGVDPETLDVVLAVTDLSEDEVYDVDEQEYAQKTGTDEREKFSHLQGLADRLDELEGEASEEIREDLAALEERIDEALSAG